jgi:hypothetical protein
LIGRLGLPIAAVLAEDLNMPALAADPAQSLPWRSWYSLQRWRKRARHQLRIEPLCAACLAQGRLTPATIADHI